MNSVNLVIQRLAAHPFEVFCATGIALGLYKYYKIENIYQENFAHFDRQRSKIELEMYRAKIPKP